MASAPTRWPLPGAPNFVYLNTGNTTFDDRRAFGTGSDETRSVAFGDLNGDGHLDIVTANIGEANGVYFGDGMGNFDDAGVKFGRAAIYIARPVRPAR